MAKDRDRDRESDGSVPNQSKRPTFSQHNSDSQVSDHAQQQLHRKPQKHVVGGAGRLHARVPSSKALHKHHTSASTSKLQRRAASPSPEQGDDDGGVPSATYATTHRRALSEVKLSRDSSATNLKKNSSQSSLKRNRSNVDVRKKGKSLSTGNIKRSSSNPSVDELKFTKAQVHFDLGNDEQEEEVHEDEWVDASSNASPLLSRRGSIAATGHTSTNEPDGAEGMRPETPNKEPEEHTNTISTTASTTSTTTTAATAADRVTAQHKEYLTSRLLQRTPTHGAPPKMSAETASVRPPSSRPHSPDAADSHVAASALSNASSRHPDGRPGSSGKEELTSRFVATNSQGSTGNGSFFPAAQREALTRPTNGKTDGPPPRRPRSEGNLRLDVDQKGKAVDKLARPEDPQLTDDDEENGGLVASARQRRSAGNAVPRTQQKLNLQRAISSLEPAVHHPGLGMGLAGVAVAAGPLVGGSGYEARDPRLGRLLERTGMEYLVVRRYQNPIARSLARLSQLPGANRSRQIPKPGSAAGSVETHAKRVSDHNAGRLRLSQDLHDHDVRDPSVATLMHGAGRPSTPKRTMSSLRNGVNGSHFDADEDGGRVQERLSGSSLVDGEEDAGTIALLRNLWDKNMDLSASQD